MTMLFSNQNIIKQIAFLLFLVQLSKAEAQNSDSISSRWNIDKYIWSNAIYKKNKTNKPLIDFHIIDNWVEMKEDGEEAVAISPHGDYFSYVLVNQPYMGNTLVVESVDKAWKKSFVATRGGFFSADNTQYIYQNENSLFFLALGHDTLKTINNVTSCVQVGKINGEWMIYSLGDDVRVLHNLVNGKEKRFENVINVSTYRNGDWIAFQLKNQTRDLLLYHLQSGKLAKYSSVEGFGFDPNSEALILKTVRSSELKYIRVVGENPTSFWSSTTVHETIGNFNFDNSGRQIVFTVTDTSSKTNSIWYWKVGAIKAKMLLSDKSKDIGAGMSIQSDAFFWGNQVLFTLKKMPSVLPSMRDPVQVDIWSFKDRLLQSSQQNPKDYNTMYACINPETKDVIRLNNEYEQLRAGGDNFVILVKDVSASCGDRYWEKDYIKDSAWLLSMLTGRRELLTAGAQFKWWGEPGGEYGVYCDIADGCNYYSINKHTGKRVKISQGIQPWLLGEESFYVSNPGKPADMRGIAGWVSGNAVLVYDNYDIWQLSLNGKEPPVNITNGYGRRNQIIFSLAKTENGEGSQLNLAGIPTLRLNMSLLLKSFNRINKQNGVYQKILGTLGDPKLLCVGNYEIKLVPDAVEEIPNYLASWTSKPVKASKTKKWIVKRQSAEEAPNYFITSDFKKYHQLTNLQQQQGYNWMTAELRTFKQLDGTIGQGVLYKPKNFDSTKRYPVIVNFYGNFFSGELNHFTKPDYIDRPSIWDNPVWLVSHGYIVFLPDIYFTTGFWGPSVINTINGAAQYLGTLPYVDIHHLAACGHSNSGTFGYYALTHSHSFAAMSVGGSRTDIISAGLQIGTSGSESLERAERRNYGTSLNTILWKDKKNWFDHTAVLNADQVTCPLLLFHSKKDGVPLSQAEEMFASLWRLEKPVWWFQYDNGGHALSELNDKRDFTVRTTQYYDHYLKNAPAPRWMTNGIPYALKGVESRYELDPSGNCDLPEKRECPICKAWNAQFKRTPEVFAKPLAEWKLDDDIQKQMEKEETKNYDEKMKGEEQRIKENNEKLKGIYK